MFKKEIFVYETIGRPFNSKRIICIRIKRQSSNSNINNKQKHQQNKQTTTNKHKQCFRDKQCKNMQIIEKATLRHTKNQRFKSSAQSTQNSQQLWRKKRNNVKGSKSSIGPRYIDGFVPLPILRRQLHVLQWKLVSA